MLNRNLKPETIARIKKETIEKRKATRQDLYSRLVIAAFNNRHNPTGQDYLASAKRIRDEFRADSFDYSGLDQN